MLLDLYLKGAKHIARNPAGFRAGVGLFIVMRIDKAVETAGKGWHPVNVEVFALCDAATDSGGKLNVLGAFDSLQVGAYPTVYPHCAVAVRIRFRRIEQGKPSLLAALCRRRRQAVDLSPGCHHQHRHPAQRVFRVAPT
jgi:hypothetical protein